MCFLYQDTFNVFYGTRKHNTGIKKNMYSLNNYNRNLLRKILNCRFSETWFTVYLFYPNIRNSFTVKI